MSDIHALSGAYAIDALDDLERARFERHLAECADCRAEVDSLREAAGLLAETTATEPPAGLRERLLAEIDTVRPLPPLTPPEATPEQSTERSTGEPTGPTTAPERHRRRWLAPLVAAAAVIAALGGGTVAWHPWSDESPQQVPVAQQVLEAPDAQRVTQRLGNGAEATLVRSKSLHQAVLLTRNMPPPPSGKVYEMWLQDPDEGMVPAGLMPEGATAVLLSGDASRAIGAGVTVEPPGGSHVPTSDPVLLFSFEKA